MAKKAIAEIIIDGVIEKKNDTYKQEWILEEIEDLIENKKNVGLLLTIDSPGGGVYESDEVYLAVKKYKKETNRPVYAYFKSLAASGGYYIGCAADTIIANRNCLTGSIGVIAGRFVDLTKLMENYGVKSETIHTGKNKIMGSVAVPVTEEQRQIMQIIADECYEQFTSIVAESRKLDITKVKELADGRIYTAKQAKENGLVDEILNYDDAIDFIYEKVFGDKDYKSEVDEHKYEAKKSFLKRLIKDTKVNLGELTTISNYVEKACRIPFPAYFYENQNFYF